MSHIWMCHVTHMNESYHTYEWIMSHIWMSHATHMNESCHTYEWDTTHIWMSHVTHMNESYHTYEWVISHIWMSHVTCMHESCHVYVRVKQHICCNTYVACKDNLFQSESCFSSKCYTYEWVIWMSKVNTYEWVISNTCTSCCVYISESRCAYEYVVEYTWIGLTFSCHALQVNIFESVMSNNMDKLLHTYEWVM